MTPTTWTNGRGDALECVLEQMAESTILRVRGEIDLASAPALHHHLVRAAEGDRPIIADLSQVTYIDLSGIRMLEEFGPGFAHGGKTLVGIIPSALIRRIFEILGPGHIPLLATADTTALPVRPRAGD